MAVTIIKSIVDNLAQSQGNNYSSPEMREVSEVDNTLFGENSDTSTTISLTSNTSTSTEASSAPQKDKASKRKRSRAGQFEIVMNKVMEELVSSQERMKLYI